MGLFGKKDYTKKPQEKKNVKKQEEDKKKEMEDKVETLNHGLT